MTRFKVALMIVGGVLVFFGVQEMRLTTGCKSEPKKLTCAELEANGPGDNAHVVVSNFFLAPSFVYNTEKGSSNWSCVWIPAVPLDGDYAKECQAAESAGQEPGPPKNVRIIVKAKGVRNQAALEALDAKESIQGVVINTIESISGEEKKLLAQSYPGANVDTCWILELDRKPAGMGKIAGFFGGGVVCAGLGLVLLLSKK